ncbi:MAG TPA: PAS domain S-box protein [Nocardioides sp.]|nr:PAS domain S-box protein [Nocardioides sp.]
MGRDPATIVIVDDDTDVRVLIRTRLRRSGHFDVVAEGADGADAIALAAEHRPALMLLDISMPGVDGLEALPRVLDASPTTRVVVFSGFEERGLADKTRELGAVAFIEKSASLASLVERLAAIAAEEPVPAGVTTEPSGVVAATTHPPRDRQLDQRLLDEHLERFREVFEEAAIGMATATLTGRLIRGNRALAMLVRRPPDGLVGVSYGQLTDDEGAVAAALAEVNAGPVDLVQFEHGLAGESSKVRVRATLAPVRDSSGRALYLFLQVQDVTAERAAAEELRRSEERFRLLVEAVEDYAIFMLDPDGRIASWNSGAQRSKGYTADEIIGQHFRVFYPPDVQASKHPEHELETAMRVGHYEEEGWRVRKDGSRFWASVLITAVYNEAGEHVGFAKVTRDSSRRRLLEQEREHALQALAHANAELAMLNEQLQQAAEDQTQFLAVTAHELRTPIGVLGGSADTLSQHWQELTDEERTDLFDAMSSSTGRLRRLLADLLTASRLEASALEMRRERVDLAEVIDQSVAIVRRSEPESEFLLEVPPGLAVIADRDRLAQVVENLLGNALRHGASPVHVGARLTEPDTVEIRVRDSGGGVAAAFRPRLFGRFATGATGGTGLGLFIVRELARAQGGDATYEPGPPEGPTGEFVVRLPAASAPVGGIVEGG